MAKPNLSLQPSEAVVAQSAAAIYASYVSSGRVPEGKEHEWIHRAIQDAFRIARLVDDGIQSDSELG
ncbi:MAG: hypothetical protein RIS70_2657 [Planctomycetota bacterium]|jgi:hypothetical protein